MISILSQEAWDKKVIELGGSILQSWAWGEFQQSVGNKVLRFSGDDYVNQVLETDLSMGKKYLYSPRGPLGNQEAALADLHEAANKDANIIFARMEPLKKMDLPKAAKETQPLHNWLLSLEPAEDQLLIGMKPKHRYNINLSQRKGVMVREGGKQDLLVMWKLFLETASRGNFRLHPQNYYWQMFESLHPQFLKIFIAEYQGKPLAGLVLTLFGDTAVYLHGGSSVAFKETMAPYLLHWEAIKWTKANGYKFYDFGGVAPATEQQHAWSGITRFKKGFGGFELEFPGAYDLVFSPVWYNVYKNARLVNKILRG